MYFEHVNDFEKSYFLKISPINSNNEIIDQLLNLSALFITANYDDQIEKSFRKRMESARRFRSFTRKRIRRK